MQSRRNTKQKVDLRLNVLCNCPQIQKAQSTKSITCQFIFSVYAYSCHYNTPTLVTSILLSNFPSYTFSKRESPNVFAASLKIARWAVNTLDANDPPTSPPAFGSFSSVLLTLPPSVSTGKSTMKSKKPLLSSKIHPKTVCVASSDFDSLRVVIPKEGVTSRFRCVSNPFVSCDSGVDDASLSSSQSFAGMTLPEYSSTLPPASVVTSNPGICNR